MVVFALAVEMTGHFDNHLNLRKLILQKRPKMIVECGAGDGDCTKLLAHLKLWYDFELVSISDKKLDDLDGLDWFRVGISYEELKTFDDDSIGMCIIDTDHNYWTLRKELEALTPKMEEGGLVVMHDVDEFYYNTGMGMSYWNGHSYPEEEIKKWVSYGGTGLALIDFLSTYRGTFKLVEWNPNNFGCAVIEKKTVTETKVILPGSHPVFARPVTA